MVDGAPHGFALPFRAGVDAAHGALQLGELAHEVRRQIRLRQSPGGPRGVDGPRYPEHLAGQPGRQRREPAGLGLVAAQPLVEEHRVETRQARLEPDAAIGVPEEPGVAQPGHEDPLQIPRNRAPVVGLRVDDGQERRQQPPGVVDDREVVLVVNHGRREHLFRQLEELRGERAGNDRRVLHQVGHFLQQARPGGRRAAHPAAQAPRVRVEFAGDLGVAVLTLENDEVLEQLRPVLVERPDLDRPARPARRGEEAMAVRDGRRADVQHEPALRRFEAPDGEGHHPAAEQEQNPANRPAEQQLSPAVVESCIPVHLLRERQVAQQARQRVREHVHRSLAADALAVAQVDALGCLHPFQVGGLHPLFPGKPRRRRRRLAVRPDRRGDGRSHDQVFQVGLPLGQARHARGQAPGRAVGFDRRAAGQAQALQARGQMLAGLLRQARQPAGRHLLAAEFDQQFAVHVRHASCGRTASAALISSSANALATATANWRTRST